MRILYVYNPYNKEDIETIERAKPSLGNAAIELVNVFDCPQVIRNLISQTPAILFAPLNYQGSNIAGETEDGITKIQAKYLQLIDEEEREIYGSEIDRLEGYINQKEREAQDELITDMIERGVINL